MAIYYVKVQMVSRSKGRSIIAAAAYRSGKKMTDKETGKTHDYSRKTAVSFSEVFLPEEAPEEYKNSTVLWEDVQKNEKAKDAQLAREFVIALPEELTAKERQELVCDYARKLTEQGMCVDLSIHEKKGNPHAHLLCTTRPLINGKWTLKEKKEYALDVNGERIPLLDKNGQQKTDKKGRRQWKRITVQNNPFNAKEKLEEWRKLWADMANAKLPESQAIDHRSYARRGIVKQSFIHEGYGVGKEVRHELNRQIHASNRLKEIGTIAPDVIFWKKEKIYERKTICESFRSFEQIPSIDSFGDGQTRNEQSVQNMQLGDMDGYSRGGASLFVHENERTGLFSTGLQQNSEELQRVRAEQKNDAAAAAADTKNLVQSVEISVTPYVPSAPEVDARIKVLEGLISGLDKEQQEHKGFFSKLFKVFDKKPKEPVPHFEPLSFKLASFMPQIKIAFPPLDSVKLQERPVEMQKAELDIKRMTVTQPEKLYVLESSHNENLKALNGAVYNVRMRCWSVPKEDFKTLGRQGLDLRCFSTLSELMKRHELNREEKTELLGIKERTRSKGRER